MRTITLSNGVVLEDSYVVENSEALYIYTDHGYTIKELCDLLFDPKNTSRITVVFGEHMIEYTGYNKLVSVRDEGGTMITASVKRVPKPVDL